MKLYVLRLDVLEDEALYRTYYALQPAWRKENIDQFRRQADKRRSLGAGILLQRALPGADLENVCFGGNGKPFLPGTGVEFNLSHAGDYAVCAVGNRPLGCDVEQIGKYGMSVAHRFFCAEETRLLEAAVTPEAQADLFFRLWTLKESFLKAVGKGLSMPLSSFCVIFEDGRPALAGYENVWQLREFSVAGGYRCAVCAAAGERIADEPVVVTL